MRTSAIICFVLAAISAVAALGAAMNTLETRAATDAVGAIVGSFLLPLLFLIGGLSLARRSNE